jgi:ABC-type transport system involved in multi-copper enzyme maturation permease subunit
VRPALARIAAVAANAFRESVRERVLYNLVFFAILMMLSGLLLREISLRQDERIIIDLGLASIEVFGILIALFVGVSLVSKEIEKRSLYPLLAKPLRRGEFLVGRFFGLALTLLANVSAMTVGMLLTLALTSGPPDPGLLKAVYATYLSLLLIVAVAVLFSSLASTTTAAIATFCVVLAGRYSDVIRGMSEVIPDAPKLMIELLYHATPNFQNFDLKQRVVYGDPVPFADLGWLTLYALLYGGLALGLALLAFRRRDLP